MKDYKRARKRIDVSVGESVRIIRGLQEMSQNELPIYELSLLHDWGAIIMGLLILAHLLLHAKWIKRMSVKMFLRGDRRKKFRRLPPAPDFFPHLK